MISTADLLAATGLKSAKTLTRWHQRGIIPAPVVQTHPSGRGKMSYWPDWVEDFCVQLIELQRQGYSLIAAAQTLHTNRTVHALDRALTQPSAAQQFREAKIQLEDRELTLQDAVRGLLTIETERITNNELVLRQLRELCSDDFRMDLAINLLFQGYNVMLCLDEQTAQVVPDFLLGIIANHETGSQPMVVVPLLPAIKRLLPRLQTEHRWRPRVFPALKLWVEEGDALVEYPFYPIGPRGFEIVRQLGTTIGASAEPSTAGLEAENDA